MLAVIHQILICLIGNDDQVATLCELRHLFGFRTRKDDAAWVLRRVVVDGSSLWRDDPLQCGRDTGTARLCGRHVERTRLRAAYRVLFSSAASKSACLIDSGVSKNGSPPWKACTVCPTARNSSTLLRITTI